MSNRLLFALCAMVYTTGALAQATGPSAGLHPDRRPDGAPHLTGATLTPEQMERALHGIEKPVPGNVESIAATGNWWVPLRHPGMNAPYDLRGWHGAEASVGTTSTGAPPMR